MNEDIIRKLQDQEDRIARLETLEQPRRIAAQSMMVFQYLTQQRVILYPGTWVDNSSDLPDGTFWNNQIMSDFGTAPNGEQLADTFFPMQHYDGFNDINGTGDHPHNSVTGIETRVHADIRGATFGGWFNLDRLGVQEAFWSKWNSPNNFSYLLWKDAADDLFLHISQGGTAATFDVTPANPIPTTGWHFLVGRWTTALKSSFVDDSKAEAAATRTQIFDGGASLFLSSNDNAADWFRGDVAVAFICGAALSDNYLSMLYNTTKWVFGL